MTKRGPSSFPMGLLPTSSSAVPSPPTPSPFVPAASTSAAAGTDADRAALRGRDWNSASRSMSSSEPNHDAFPVVPMSGLNVDFLSLSLLLLLPLPPPRRRAYVRVVDGGDGGGDYISGVLLLDLEDPDDGGVAAAAGGGRCRAPAVADAFAAAEQEGGGSDADVVVGSLVSVCSKRDGDWDRCLLKKARIEEAIDRVDRAIE